MKSKPQVVPLADYLFKKLRKEGVEYTFGIPGDFILPLYAAQQRSGMKTVVMTHEPSAGYAADVYARLKGLGVAIATYGAGALNMVNPIGVAYAEESPVLVLTGAPELKGRRPDTLFHHRVKNYETQYRVYQEVTESATVLNDPLTAVHEMDRVIATTRRVSRPGYIEMPRDMVNAPVRPEPLQPYQPPPLNADALAEALEEVIRRLNRARKPVVYAGVEVQRFGMTDALRELVEKLNLPCVTSLMGKTVLPEHHPNFIGNYMGVVGPKGTREYVESSDCIVSLGTLFTDMDTGAYTAHIDHRNLIQANFQEVVISQHYYRDVSLKDLLQAMLASKELRRHRFTHPPADPPLSAPRGNKLTMLSILDALNQFLTPDHVVVSDVGDCLFACVDLKTDLFIGAGYYASMGLGIPGLIGAQLARPDLRPVGLVGDGGFKMNGCELGTAADLGLNPIALIVNNRSFATLRFIDQDRDYFKVRPWDYVQFAESIGGRGEQVTTRSGLVDALQRAQSSDVFYLIDALVDEDDASPALKRLGKELGARFRKKDT